MITICKKPGIKNCVRISKKEDIPEFLKDVVHIEGEHIVLDCLEGEERVPLASVIAFEKLESGKMNVGNKANWATTTIEKDGVFYDLPKSVKAILLDENISDDLLEALGDALTYENGEYHLKTDWGVSSATAKNGYLLIYGKKENGDLDANILTVGTPSFDQYYLVAENGKMGESLKEHHTKTLKSNRKV